MSTDRIRRWRTRRGVVGLTGAVGAVAASVLLLTGTPAFAGHPKRHPSTKCRPAQHRRVPRCASAEGAPRHKVHGFHIKKRAHTGAGAVPDQYLPFAAGQRTLLTQGNRSPCGWSHAPPSCNSIGAYTQYGWDFVAPYGSDVHASAPGKVVLARTGCRGSGSWGCNSGYGNTVTIETASGNCERYEHLSRVNVSPGEAVAGYAVIGGVGSSGNSTGTHLHYQREVCFGHYAGQAIPSSFIEAGVPRVGQIVTSQNHPNGQAVPASYYVLGPTGGLNVYSGASTSASVVGRLAVGSPVDIACQTKGTTVGNSPIWDQIGKGTYVPDYYLSTPADGTFSPGLTQCGTTTTPPPVKPPPGQPAYYVHHVYGTCADGSCGLNERNGPGYTNYKVVGTLHDGDAIDIVCQTRGQTVTPNHGTASNVWDKLTNGDYVTDVYVDTSGTGGNFSPPIPQC